MNKIVASLGIVALGAASIQSASAQGTGAPASKLWNVSLTLRGFYDDNPTTAPDGVDKDEVMGLQVSPAVGLNWVGDQGTAISLGYRYGLKYYGKHIGSPGKNADHDHTFNMSLEHAFSERYKISLTDAFVIGQEPDALRVGSLAAVQRIPGNNVRNYATANFNAQLTPVFGTEIGYANQLFDYEPEVASTVLDRVEHYVHIDGRWTIQPTTVGVLGYQYGQTIYSRNGDLGFGFMSSDRNSRSHYGYVGLDHTFRPDLTGSVRGGVQVADFYNDDNYDAELSPYVQASLKYTYAPESYLQLGLTQSRNATDVLGVDGNDFVHDSDTTVVFGSIMHRIVPNLFGGLNGTFQNTAFNGGTLDGDTEQYASIGVNLQYRFNAYLSSEVGYNYDSLLNSDVDGREYDRNRVYIGVTASY